MLAAMLSLPHPPVRNVMLEINYIRHYIHVLVVFMKFWSDIKCFFHVAEARIYIDIFIMPYDICIMPHHYVDKLIKL